MTPAQAYRAYTCWLVLAMDCIGNRRRWAICVRHMDALEAAYGAAVRS